MWLHAFWVGWSVLGHPLPADREVSPARQLTLFIWHLVCYSEGAVCGQSLAERAETLLQMETILQASGFPYHLAHLEEVGWDHSPGERWGGVTLQGTGGSHAGAVTGREIRPWLQFQVLGEEPLDEMSEAPAQGSHPVP